MNILITGASGFIGGELVESLKNNDMTLRLFVRDKDKVKSDQDLEVIEGDISDALSVAVACKNIDVVVHLAAAMSGDWDWHKRVTISGTNNIISACRSNNVKHLIYISTINVYDSNSYKDGVTVDENFKLEENPEFRGAYSGAKLLAEQKVAEATDILSTILRPGLVYGQSNKIISADVALHLFKNLYAYIGDGSRKLPMIYVSNLANAIVKVVEASPSSSMIYNVVDRDSPTQRQVVDIYNNYSKTKIICISFPKWLVKIPISIIDVVFKVLGKNKHIMYRANTFFVSPVVNSDKFRKAYRWESGCSFSESIKSIIK